MLNDEEYMDEQQQKAYYKEYLQEEGDIQAWMDIIALRKAGKAEPINARRVFTAPGDAARGPPGSPSKF